MFTVLEFWSARGNIHQTGPDSRGQKYCGPQTTYTYDNTGNLASFLYPNGVKHAYQYNALNRLTDLFVTAASSTLASYSYALGPIGNRTSVTEFGGRKVDYTYDELYRLKTEAISGAGGGTTTYSYDAVGNPAGPLVAGLPLPPLNSAAAR